MIKPTMLKTNPITAQRIQFGSFLLRASIAIQTVIAIVTAAPIRIGSSTNAPQAAIPQAASASSSVTCANAGSAMRMRSRTGAIARSFLKTSSCYIFSANSVMTGIRSRSPLIAFMMQKIASAMNASGSMQEMIDVMQPMYGT